MSWKEERELWAAICNHTKTSILSKEELVELFFNKIALLCLETQFPESAIDAGLLRMKRCITSVADDKGIEFDWSKVKLMNV